MNLHRPIGGGGGAVVVALSREILHVFTLHRVVGRSSSAIAIGGHVMRTSMCCE